MLLNAMSVTTAADIERRTKSAVRDPDRRVGVGCRNVSTFNCVTASPQRVLERGVHAIDKTMIGCTEKGCTPGAEGCDYRQIAEPA